MMRFDLVCRQWHRGMGWLATEGFEAAECSRPKFFVRTYLLVQLRVAGPKNAESVNTKSNVGERASSEKTLPKDRNVLKDIIEPRGEFVCEKSLGGKMFLTWPFHHLVLRATISMEAAPSHPPERTKKYSNRQS
jgi:hypothetical protein